MINDEILNKISSIIEKYRVFLVGGYLRNLYINNAISVDRDLVCIGDACELAKEIALYFDATFIELDTENKIYRVVLKDKINYIDISETSDINLDAKRRDLTINSIFYDLNNKTIFDPFDGINDIKNKILRTVDYNNLIDDPLRFLRVYRFLSLTGFKTDDKLSDFIKENFDLINNVAKERINYEIIKIFEGDYVVEALLKMLDDNTLEKVFPFVKQIKKIPSNTHHHLDLIHHSIETVKNIRTNNPLLKIAAFYHDIGKPMTWTIEPKGRHRFIGHDIQGGKLVKTELQKLHFSNKQINYISKMVENHIYPASLINCADNKKAFARFIRKMGEDTLDVIELSRADRLSARGILITDEVIKKALNHLENLKEYYKKNENMAKSPKSLLNGEEIMKILNISPSKKVGEIIEELIELQISGDIVSREDAIKFIESKKKFIAL